MADEKNNTPLLNRSDLLNEFDQSNETVSKDIRNLPHVSPSMPLPNVGGEPTPSALSALENSIISTGNRNNNGKLTGGGINRALAESGNERYNAFIPGGYDNEDAYAQGQGWPSKMINGVGKGLLLTGTTFVQSTVGMVNGVARWIDTGRAASFYDNDFNKWLDEVNKQAENSLPNYYKNSERDANWYSPEKLFSANFLWDGIVKNMGFAAGAALSGGLFAKGLSALPLTARLFSVGKAAEALAATEEALVAGNKAAETYGKIKSLSDKFLGSYNILNPAGRAVVAGLATTGEAGFEAFHNLNEFRDAKIQEYKDTHFGEAPKGADLDKINSASDAVGNSSFMLNTALLSATNYIQFPKILGSSYKSEKGIINGLSKETNEIVRNKAGDFIAKTGKNRLLSTINKVRPYLFSTSEGFEEGAQYAIQVGTQHYYNNIDHPELASIMSSISEGIDKTINTNEGMENVLIGGLSGSLMMAKGRYTENREKAKNTADAVQRFNDWRLSDFTKATANSVGRGVAIQENRERSLKKGDVLESKDAETDYIINYLTPRLQYGRYDLVKADIEDYKRLASTDQGFAQLQSEGKALPNDDRMAYLQRLSNLESTAENMKSLFQSLQLRYSGLTTKDGKPAYSPDVINQMVYAATKIADYDKRIPELSSNLIGEGIDVDGVINDVLEGKHEKLVDSLEKLKASNKINAEQLQEDLSDIAEMSLRRKLFFSEYSEMKKKPENFTPTNTVDNSITPEEKKIIKIKTKGENTEFETGEEYYLGRVVEHDAAGHEVYRAPRLTILGENEDGTIKIKDSAGNIKDVSKEVFADYKLSKVSAVEDNKKAKFFMANWNTVYEFNFGKGNKRKGRLEYSAKDNILLFVYKDNKGKIKQIEVTNKQFVAKKGYDKAIISPVGTLTTEQQSAQSEFLTSTDPRSLERKDQRIKILNDLYEEVSTKQNEIKKLLDRKKKDLADIVDSLAKEEQLIADAKFTKKNRFKAATRKALETAMRLSRAKEQVQEEIANLESQVEEADIAISYISDLHDNIDELPVGKDEFLEVLNDDLLNLEVIKEETAKQIGALKALEVSLEKAIDKAIKYVHSIIDNLQRMYPNVPAPTGQDWVDFLKDNPNFLRKHPDYKSDLKFIEGLVAETEDVFINPDTKKLEDVRNEAKDLENQLEEVDKEIRAKDVILKKFSAVVAEYNKQKETEAKFKKDQELIQKMMGTADVSTPVVDSTSEYEVESKKTNESIPTSTKPVKSLKPHHVRANTFGANLDKFSNRKKIRGVVITSKNESLLGLKGLTQFLKDESDAPAEVKAKIDPSKTIALVMVEEQPDGTLIPIGVDGKKLLGPIISPNTAIFQVFPDPSLTWSGQYTKSGKSETMFRQGTDPETIDYYTENYAGWVNDTLQQTGIVGHEIDASFGKPQYVEYLDEKGQPKKDNSAITPVEEAGLVSKSDLRTSPVLQVATSETVDKGSTTYRTPLGRLFLSLSNGLVKLQNRKLSTKEAEVVFDTLVQLSKHIYAGEKVDSPQVRRSLTWLKSIVYWGIPKNSAGHNSMFWTTEVGEEEEEGKLELMPMLSISGKGAKYEFTPSALQENKAEIMTLISAMYHNVNSGLANKDGLWDASYEQFVGIDSKGEPIVKKWENYQTYLLSGEGRKANEIPVFTQMAPITDEKPTNREGIYFTVTDLMERYDKPPIKKTIVPKKTEAKKEKIATAPTTKGEKQLAPGQYILDGKTVNTYKSAKGAIIKFTALSGADKNPFRITILEDAGDYEDVVNLIMQAKKVDADVAVKQVKELLKNSIASSLAPKVTAPKKGSSSLQESADGMKVDIPEDYEDENQTNDDSLVMGKEKKETPPKVDDENVILVTDDKTEDDNEDAQSKAFFARQKRRSDRRGAARRAKLATSILNFKSENWTKTEKWLKENFPNIPVHRVKNIIKSINGSVESWGMLQDGAIYVYENAEVGTIYHEVFEAVWKMFTDGKEQSSILDEFKQRKGSFVDRPTGKEIKHSEASPEQIKEQLAEEFRDFVLYKKSPAKATEGKSFISRMFADLVNFIKSFFTGEKAQVNTTNLFDRIGRGYYKTAFPEQTALSYAKQGLIDIDEVFAREGAENRIKTIPADRVHELMQQMTYDTIYDLLDDSKGLFKMPSINVNTHYANLKRYIDGMFAEEIAMYQADIKDENVGEEEGQQIIKGLMDLSSSVNNEWSELVKKHREYLAAYSIEFDDEDTLNVTSDENTGKGEYESAHKIDNFKKANGAVKLLLSSVPVVDNKGDLELTAIGSVRLEPVSKIFMALMNNLHSSRNIDEMITRIRKMSEDDVTYKSLYTRIMKSNKDLSTIDNIYNGQLISALWSTFKKQNPEVKNVYIFENGDIEIGDSNLASAARDIAKKYSTTISRTISSKKSELFKFDEKRKVFVGVPTKVGTEPSNTLSRIEFLKKLGINFTITEVNNKIKGEQLEAFKSAVSGIYKSIKASEGIITVNGKTLDIAGRIMQLSTVRAAIENPEFESTFFSIKGERVQSFIGTNTASDFYDAISQIDNLQELEGTRYEYLLSDVFASNSAILRKMFDVETGNRKTGSTQLMSTAWADGTVELAKGKKTETSKLTYKQRLIQEINLNIKGYYYTLVPGDASLQWMQYMGNHITSKQLDRGFDDVFSIFKGYFISELKLARENRPVAKGREAKDLRFFKDILNDDVLHDKIIKSKKSPEKTYEQYQSQIDSAVKAYITREANSTKSVLEEYGATEKVSRDTDYGFRKDEYNEEDEAALNIDLMTISVNYIINNIELHKLIYSDPYQYADELKRIKNFNSPRQAIISDSANMNKALDNIWNKGYDKDDLGHTDMLRDHFRTATTSDVIAISDLPGYTPYEETDGSGIISFKAYRNFRIRAGNWSEAEERQYRYEMAYEKQEKGIEISLDEQYLLDKGNPQVKSAYTPLKPIVSGNKGNNKIYNDVVLHKFALYPLSYRVMHSMNPTSNALKLYDKMQKEDVDYIVFKTGAKVGAGELSPLYNENGSFNTDPFVEISNIPYGIVSIQSEVPSKEGNSVTRGSQMTKLATLDAMEAGIPVDFEKDKSFTERYKAWYSISSEKEKEAISPLYKEIKNNQKLLEAGAKVAYNSLLRKMGIKEVDGAFEIKDFTKTVKLLKEELLKRELNDNISDALNGFANGDVVLEATPSYQQIRNILYSIADKNVISPKVNGGQKVQIPSTLFESNRIVSTDINGKKGFTSDVLKFYEDKDGQRVCEVMIGRWFKSSMSDEAILKYLNETPEGQRILSGVGFRIPTQRQNSIDAFRIKQFLPYEFGDSVVIPSALVQKAGSDFDIDKLSMYFKNIKIEGGKPKLIQFLTEENSTPEERYFNWVMENADKDVSKYVRALAKDEVGKIKEKFSTEFKAINAKYPSLLKAQKDKAHQSLTSGYEAIEPYLEQVRTEQDEYMAELFEAGKNAFFTLSKEVREDYFTIKDELRRKDIKGPKEIEAYLALTVSKLQDSTTEASQADILKDMLRYYEEELRVIGITQEKIKEYKQIVVDQFKETKNALINTLNIENSKQIEELREKEQSEKQAFNFQYASEVAEIDELPTLDEFKKMSIYDQNTKKSIENAYIESLERLITSEHNFKNLIAPNSSKQLKDLAKDVSKKLHLGEFDYQKIGNMINRKFMSRLRHAFVSGKYAIGIAAVNQTNLAQNQRSVIYVDPNRFEKVDEKELYWLTGGTMKKEDIAIKFKKYNSILKGGKKVATLSMIKNADGQNISDIVSQFIDGYVDIGKGPWIMELGATPNVASTFLFLAKIGVPIEDVAYFMNQPIIKDYLKSVEKAGFSWLFIDDIIETTRREYETSKDYMANKLLIEKVKEIPSKYELGKMMGVKSLTTDQKAQQQFILTEFLKYAQMANHMFLVTQGSNYDTANFSDPYLVFKKHEQYLKAQKSIISSVDDLIDNSFVGDLRKRIYDIREAYAQILSSERPEVRGVIESTLRPFVDVNDRDFVKLARKVVNTLFDWSVQVDKGVAHSIEKMMIDEDSVAGQVYDIISEIKKNRTHPLHHNLIVKQLSLSHTDKLTNIKIDNAGNKVYDQNQIIYSFEELRNYFKGDKNKLYQKIVSLAVLQSGLSSSPISFTSLLPYEDFQKIYNATLSKLNERANLSDFNTLNVFERTNWNDQEIVPTRKAKFKQNYDGTTSYNVNMELKGYASAKAAVKEGKLPELLKLNIQSKEADNDIITYTWEKFDELLSSEDQKKSYSERKKLIKEKKNEMRKKGDYSFINKGLFKKVRHSADNTPLMTEYSFTTEDGVKVTIKEYVYKLINAWGASFSSDNNYLSANEFYSEPKVSVIDNGYLKTDEVADDVIIPYFKKTAPKGKPSSKPNNDPSTSKIPNCA